MDGLIASVLGDSFGLDPAHVARSVFGTAGTANGIVAL
jgi:hypothetical protein